MNIEHIPAGKFKTHCLKLLDDVDNNHRSLIVTKHGKPVAKLVPITNKPVKKERLFGRMKGSVKILGDIVSPMPEIWNLPE